MNIECGRASARAEEFCHSDFGRVAAVIEHLDGTTRDCGMVRTMEALLPPPKTLEEWRWLALRLALNLADGRSPECAGALLWLAVGDDEVVTPNTDRAVN